MKSDKKILFAFILNLAFSIFECIGGIFTGSFAILADAIHDVGDAFSIGVSYLLERKSKHEANSSYTYGYGRYSVLGSVLTASILLVGTVTVCINAIPRLIHPIAIDYNGILVFAIIGVIVNFAAAVLTHGGHSINQKAVSLHMLEDVMGWVTVLIGAVVMKITGFSRIDAVLSICIALYVAWHAIKLLHHSCAVLVEKVPADIDIVAIQKHLMSLDGVISIHHIHVWSLDGFIHCATLHAVINNNAEDVKDRIRHELQQQGIQHVTIECESAMVSCDAVKCTTGHEHCHHHHHHHHD